MILSHPFNETICFNVIKKEEKKETIQNDIVLGMYGEQYLLPCVRLPISCFS